MPRLRARNQLTAPSESISTSRPRRSAPVAKDIDEEIDEDTTIVARPSPPRSSRVTLKMPSVKLREATAAKKGRSLAEREAFEPGEVVRGTRSTRAKKSVVIDSDSDDDDLMDGLSDGEGADEGLHDGAGEDARGGSRLGAGLDADGDGDTDEDADGEEDFEMPDAPAPKVTVTQPPREAIASRKVQIKKPSPKAPKVRVQPVEEKEIQMADAGLSDISDELSELSEQDAEGELEDEIEEEEEEGGDEDGEDDGLGESDDETPGGTPDPTRMTQRQRKGLEQDFLQLPMEPQIKKHLTAEEHAMRRAEMARRRKNLSEKRNEEEKMETINRLLKKQAPKRRGKLSAQEVAEVGADTPEIESREMEKPIPVFTRWISNSKGKTLSLPGEWKDTPMGALAGQKGWKMVEEV